MTEKFKANNSLKANAVGWHGQLFQCIAHMAPAAAIISTAPFMASRAGWAMPVGFMLATVLALLLSYCLSQLTKKYYGASGYFQIHSKALGSTVGFTTSWMFFLYEPFSVFVGFYGFGLLILEPFSQQFFGFTIPWWAALIVGNFLIIFLSLKKIKNSINVTAVLGVLEIIVFFALAILLLKKSPHEFHPAYFMPSSSADGIGGILFAFVFAFMCFMGFESGLPLTEETKDRAKSTFRGLIWSVVFAGVFFTFVGYATIVGFGAGDSTQSFAKAFSETPNTYGSVLALKAFGTIGPWLVFFATLNSAIAGALAGNNSIVRVFFSLGRAGILPKKLGYVSSRTNAPVNAVLFSGTLTFTIGLVFYFLTKTGNAMEWFGFIALTLTLPLLFIHLMTCISVFVAYRFKEKQDFHFILHGIIPLVTGLLILLPIWGAVYYNPDKPMSYAPLFDLGWFIIGIIAYKCIKAKRPETLKTLEHEMELIAHQ